MKLAIFLFSVVILKSAPSFSKGYSYIDGSNNEYIIQPDSIIYDPITPIESSSGEYNGGEPKRVKISTTQFEKIELIIKAILKDKANHQKTRQMGCGTLVSGKKQFYIKSSSALKKDLETELKLCLQN